MKETPKQCPINRRFRVQFETDAENDYFNRDQEQGQFSVILNDDNINDFALNLWNGLANLTVELPTDVQVGDMLYFKTETMDNSRAEPFLNEFYVKIGDPEEKSTNGKPGKRRQSPNGSDDEEQRKTESKLDLPNIIRLRKQDIDWKRYFKNDSDALSVKDSGVGGYDFYINMDNVYLQTEIKGNTKVDHRILEARFEYGMVLIGISLIEDFDNKESKGKNQKTELIDNASTFEKISQLTRAISPILLPMIASLGDLEISS